MIEDETLRITLLPKLGCPRYKLLKLKVIAMKGKRVIVLHARSTVFSSGSNDFALPCQGQVALR